MPRSPGTGLRRLQTDTNRANASFMPNAADAIAKVAGKSRRGSAPGEHRGGRAKGTANKTTQAVKDMITEALALAGGAQYLFRQSEANPGPFMALVGKVLPLQLTGDAGAPIVLQLTSVDERL